jgi:hypothetical protein
MTLLPLNYDQRGPRFPRTLPDGTIDIAAYQHQGSVRVFANGFESGPYGEDLVRSGVTQPQSEGSTSSGPADH